jgi:hypothetical protein
MAALAGVRVLLAHDLATPSDGEARRGVTRALLAAGPQDPMAAAARYGVTHLVVTPELLEWSGTTFEDLAARPYLRVVELAGDPARDYVALFAVGMPGE